MTDNLSARVDVGARQVARRVRVAADAPALFAMVADPHRHGEVDGSGTVHTALRGPHRLGLGDQFSMRMSFGPIPYRMTCTVTAFEADRVIEWRHPFGHRWRWEFTPIDAGHTEVTEIWDYRTAWSAAFLEAVRYPAANGRSIKQTLDALARRF